jgi:hypothetical protein
LNAGPHHVVARQQLAAERGAGDLDAARQADLFLAGEQRDLAHLRQVHPHRVVRPRVVVFLDPRQEIVLFLDFLKIRAQSTGRFDQFAAAVVVVDIVQR